MTRRVITAREQAELAEPFLHLAADKAWQDDALDDWEQQLLSPSVAVGDELSPIEPEVLVEEPNGTVVEEPAGPTHFHPDFVKMMDTNIGVGGGYAGSAWQDYHDGGPDYWHETFKEQPQHAGKEPILNPDFVSWMDEQNHDSPATWQDYHSDPKSSQDYQSLYDDLYGQQADPAPPAPAFDAKTIAQQTGDLFNIPSDLIQSSGVKVKDMTQEQALQYLKDTKEIYNTPDYADVLDDIIKSNFPEQPKKSIAENAAEAFAPAGFKVKTQDDFFKDHVPGYQPDKPAPAPYVQDFMDAANSKDFFGPDGEDADMWKKELAAVNSPEFDEWFSKKYPKDPGEPLYPDVVVGEFLSEQKAPGAYQGESLGEFTEEPDLPDNIKNLLEDDEYEQFDSLAKNQDFQKWFNKNYPNYSPGDGDADDIYYSWTYPWGSEYYNQPEWMKGVPYSAGAANAIADWQGDLDPAQIHEWIDQGDDGGQEAQSAFHEWLDNAGESYPSPLDIEMNNWGVDVDDENYFYWKDQFSNGDEDYYAANSGAASEDFEKYQAAQNWDTLHYQPSHGPNKVMYDNIQTDELDWEPPPSMMDKFGFFQDGARAFLMTQFPDMEQDDINHLNDEEWTELGNGWETLSSSEKAKLKALEHDGLHPVQSNAVPPAPTSHFAPPVPVGPFSLDEVGMPTTHDGWMALAHTLWPAGEINQATKEQWAELQMNPNAKHMELDYVKQVYGDKWQNWLDQNAGAAAAAPPSSSSHHENLVTSPEFKAWFKKDNSFDLDVDDKDGSLRKMLLDPTNDWTMGKLIQFNKAQQNNPDSTYDFNQGDAATQYGQLLNSSQKFYNWVKGVDGKTFSFYQMYPQYALDAWNKIQGPAAPPTQKPVSLDDWNEILPGYTMWFGHTLKGKSFDEQKKALEETAEKVGTGYELQNAAKKLLDTYFGGGGDVDLIQELLKPNPWGQAAAGDVKWKPSPKMNVPYEMLGPSGGLVPGAMAYLWDEYGSQTSKTPAEWLEWINGAPGLTDGGDKGWTPEDWEIVGNYWNSKSTEQKQDYAAKPLPPELTQAMGQQPKDTGNTIYNDAPQGNPQPQAQSTMPSIPVSSYYTPSSVMSGGKLNADFEEWLWANSDKTMGPEEFIEAIKGWNGKHWEAATKVFFDGGGKQPAAPAPDYDALYPATGLKASLEDLTQLQKDMAFPGGEYNTKVPDWMYWAHNLTGEQVQQYLSNPTKASDDFSEWLSSPGYDEYEDWDESHGGTMSLAEEGLEAFGKEVNGSGSSELPGWLDLNSNDYPNWVNSSSETSSYGKWLESWAPEELQFWAAHPEQAQYSWQHFYDNDGEILAPGQKPGSKAAPGAGIPKGTDTPEDMLAADGTYTQMALDYMKQSGWPVPGTTTHHDMWDKGSWEAVLKKPGPAHPGWEPNKGDWNGKGNYKTWEEFKASQGGDGAVTGTDIANYMINNLSHNDWTEYSVGMKHLMSLDPNEAKTYLQEMATSPNPSISQDAKATLDALFGAEAQTPPKGIPGWVTNSEAGKKYFPSGPQDYPGFKLFFSDLKEMGSAHGVSQALEQWDKLTLGTKDAYVTKAQAQEGEVTQDYDPINPHLSPNNGIFTPDFKKWLGDKGLSLQDFVSTLPYAKVKTLASEYKDWFLKQKGEPDTTAEKPLENPFAKLLAKPTFYEQMSELLTSFGASKVKLQDNKSKIQEKGIDYVKAELKKQMKKETNPEKFVKLVDLWQKNFGGPTGSGAITPLLKKHKPGQPLNQAALVALWQLKDTGELPDWIKNAPADTSGDIWPTYGEQEDPLGESAAAPSGDFDWKGNLDAQSLHKLLEEKTWDDLGDEPGAIVSSPEYKKWFAGLEKYKQKKFAQEPEKSLGYFKSDTGWENSAAPKAEYDSAKFGADVAAAHPGEKSSWWDYTSPEYAESSLKAHIESLKEKLADPDVPVMSTTKTIGDLQKVYDKYFGAGPSPAPAQGGPLPFQGGADFAAEYIKAAEANYADPDEWNSSGVLIKNMTAAQAKKELEGDIASGYGNPTKIKALYEKYFGAGPSSNPEIPENLGDAIKWATDSLSKDWFNSTGGYEDVTEQKKKEILQKHINSTNSFNSEERDKLQQVYDKFFGSGSAPATPSAPVDMTKQEVTHQQMVDLHNAMWPGIEDEADEWAANVAHKWLKEFYAGSTGTYGDYYKKQFPNAFAEWENSITSNPGGGTKSFDELKEMIKSGDPAYWEGNKHEFKELTPEEWQTRLEKLIKASQGNPAAFKSGEVEIYKDVLSQLKAMPSGGSIGPGELDEEKIYKLLNKADSTFSVWSKDSVQDMPGKPKDLQGWKAYVQDFRDDNAYPQSELDVYQEILDYIEAVENGEFAQAPSSTPSGPPLPPGMGSWGDGTREPPPSLDQVARRQLQDMVKKLRAPESEGIYGPEDIKTALSSEFQKWWGDAPPEYRKVTEKFPYIAMDDFSNGGEYGWIPEATGDIPRVYDPYSRLKSDKSGGTVTWPDGTKVKLPGDWSGHRPGHTFNPPAPRSHGRPDADLEFKNRPPEVPGQLEIPLPDGSSWNPEKEFPTVRRGININFDRYKPGRPDFKLLKRPGIEGEYHRRAAQLISEIQDLVTGSKSWDDLYNLEGDYDDGTQKYDPATGWTRPKTLFDADNKDNYVENQPTVPSSTYGSSVGKWLNLMKWAGENDVPPEQMWEIAKKAGHDNPDEFGTPPMSYFIEQAKRNPKQMSREVSRLMGQEPGDWVADDLSDIERKLKSISSGSGYSSEKYDKQTRDYAAHLYDKWFGKGFFNDLLAKKIVEAVEYGVWKPSEFKSHPDIGGMGPHWTTKDNTDFGGSEGAGESNLPVEVVVEWSGAGEDPDSKDGANGYEHEKEVTLNPGSPIRVKQLVMKHHNSGIGNKKLTYDFDTPHWRHASVVRPVPMQVRPRNVKRILTHREMVEG